MKMALITRWRRAHLAVALAMIVGIAAAYWVARLHQEPLDTAVAAEPRIPAAPPPASAVTPAQLPSATNQPIPVVSPRTQSVSSYVDITGNAASVNAVKLIARVEGYLDQIQYKDQLQQAQAQVLAAQAALVYAKTELVRYSKLVKQDAATQTEVDTWTYKRAAAEAELLGAQAQVALAKLNLGYTEVRAPFDGIVGKHLIDPGNVVGSPGQQSALAEITQLDPIYVVANLSEQQVLQIRQNLGQHRLTFADLRKVPVDAALSDQTGFPLQGTLEYVSPALDPATGTLLVRGILSNPDRTLLPGFFVKMRLPMAKVDRNALLVPDRSLQEDQGGRYLLIVNKDDVVEQRYVQLGQLDGALRVITSGLKPDDRVVVGDLWRATPGTKVTPRLTQIEATSTGAKP